MIYFVPEAGAAYEAIGLTGRRMGYFASRAAAMGAVPAEVVIATFFNFHPALVRRSIPLAWEHATPADILAARLDAADAALRRVLGSAINSDDMREAAALARDAAAGCFPEGRPLYAGHAALPWPDAPHLVLWHAQTLLREFRGDGHIAAMVTEGITGPEALVIHGATGEVPNEALQQSRAWPDDEWNAATESVRARGWLASNGTLTPAGQKSRQWVEDRTDELMLVCWERIGEDECARLRELVRPFSRAIASDAFDFGPSLWED
jgi:Helix-turn-helix family